MMMSAETEMPLTFYFHRKSDGRYSVKSPGVPGLFLASKDLDALWRDLEISIRDLLFWNRDIVVDGIRWEPSHTEAFKKVSALKPAQILEDVPETCIITFKAAA